uniref:Uncharacterized protein n=1 Tax=viral metagenome TaxID=1070528 RepID=A0A6H1ZWR6_9ZZZZ
MTDKLMCPFLLIYLGRNGDSYCLKEKCALYLEEASCCSFNAIGWVLGDTNHQLLKVAERLFVITREMKRSR